MTIWLWITDFPLFMWEFTVKNWLQWRVRSIIQLVLLLLILVSFEPKSRAPRTREKSRQEIKMKRRIAVVALRSKISFSFIWICLQWAISKCKCTCNEANEINETVKIQIEKLINKVDVHFIVKNVYPRTPWATPHNAIHRNPTYHVGVTVRFFSIENPKLFAQYIPRFARNVFLFRHNGRTYQLVGVKFNQKLDRLPLPDFASSS